MKSIKKIIVLGGSAGSIPSLCEIVTALPDGLAAALLVVIHHGEKESRLPQVLQRLTNWKVLVPQEVEPLKAGCIYLAATDKHLVVRDGCAFSIMGPRENRHRPAVDVLFRSAARAHQTHVIAVTLSGALDDGSAGSLAVKARRGIVIVEDPALAMNGGMPSNVQSYVGADYSLPVTEIAGVLTKIVPKGSTIGNQPTSRRKCEKAKPADVFQESPCNIFSCPECEGAMQLTESKGVPQFRCHVGHVFSLESFSEAESEALERAIWLAYRKLKEHRTIQMTLARRDQTPGETSRFHQSAEAADSDLKLLRGILARL